MASARVILHTRGAEEMHFRTGQGLDLKVRVTPERITMDFPR